MTVQCGKNGKVVVGVIISLSKGSKGGRKNSRMQGIGALHVNINICQLIYELL
jgi:hypothetical protein